MDDFGLRDQYSPDMTLMGTPESLLRLHQSNIPANSVCMNKNMDSRMKPDEENQRLFPMKQKSLERRIDEYEKTSPCNYGSPRYKESFGSTNENTISFSQETIFLFFIFIIFIFIVIHFNSSINEIKRYLKTLTKPI